MQTVLALETSSSKSSIGLQLGEKILLKYIDFPVKQVEFLTDTVAHMLSSYNLPFSAINKIIVNTGPGSYTGLRIGIATAQGYSLALGRPILGVAADEVIAFTLSKNNHFKQNLRVVIAAYLGYVWVSDFTPDLHRISKLKKVKISEPLALNNYLVGGSEGVEIELNAENLLKYTTAKCPDSFTLNSFEPIYL